MSIQDRIKKVRAESKQTQEQFSASIGLKRDNYAQIETGKQNPSFEVLSAIVRIYHKTYDWLIDGKEPKEEKEPYPTTKGKVMGKDRGKLSVVSEPDSYIKNLTPKNNPQIIDHVVDTSGLRLVPVVDIRAAAGDGYLNADSIDETQVLRLPATMVKSGYHLCIRVKGPSMAPTYQDGGFLIIRLLERSEWLNLRNEYCFVVVDAEGKTYIKRLKNRFTAAGGFIVCTSDNPDKTSHPNFNLEPHEILHIWFVEWYLTAKMPNIHDQYYSRVSNLEDKFDLLAREFQDMKRQLK